MISLNKGLYSILCLVRNKRILKVINNTVSIADYNMIIPNLYLGNIIGANNVDFLKKNNIQSIINCTENEPFNEYFNDGSIFRLSINDSRDETNINKFKREIIHAIDFIDNSIEQNQAVYVHCYWGLMRSATVVAGYLIKKYNLTVEESINIIKEQRPRALVSFYNFNDVLKYVENEYSNRDI
jgi:protein-tyrosine phosphatase